MGDVTVTSVNFTEQYWCGIFKKCWLFEINRHFLLQFSPEHNGYMFMFVFFPKSDERHKFELFYRRVTILRDGFPTDYQ